jgi:regulator of replication initiation timing
MKYDIYQRLIGHVSKNEWADAKDLFESIIHEKVALRLEEEKRRTVSAEEDSLHEPKKNDKKQLLVEPEEDEKEKVDESTPPGEESWVKANKARFKKEYGPKKGTEVLYATAWRNKNKGK